MRKKLSRRFLLLLAILSPAALLSQEAKQVKSTDFETIHVIAGENRFDVSASYGTFTLDGPKLETLKPLPSRIQKVAVDPETKKMYGINSHEVFRIDGATAETLTVPPDLPKLSWTCGITFDSKRKRVLVATLGGEGFLYSYSPVKDEWSLVASMRNVDVAGITYSSVDDRIYAIHSPFGGNRQLELLRYNADGALLKALLIRELRLLARIGRTPPGAHLQLTTLDQQIVAVTSKSQFPNEQDLDAKNHIFTIDPQTGDIKLTAEY